MAPDFSSKAAASPRRKLPAISRFTAKLHDLTAYQVRLTPRAASCPTFRELLLFQLSVQVPNCALLSTNASSLPRHTTWPSRLTLIALGPDPPSRSTTLATSLAKVMSKVAPASFAIACYLQLLTLYTCSANRPCQLRALRRCRPQDG